HHHRLGGIDFRVDLVVESLARRDLRIPPHRPALRLDRGDQRRDARLVGAGVGNEDVSHGRQLPATVSGAAVFAAARRASAASTMAPQRGSSCSNAKSGSTLAYRSRESVMDAKTGFSMSSAASFSFRYTTSEHAKL